MKFFQIFGIDAANRYKMTKKVVGNFNFLAVRNHQHYAAILAFNYRLDYHESPPINNN